MPQATPRGPLGLWMKAKRVTTKEMAAKARIHPGRVSQFRQGKSRPSDDDKIAIERATREIETELGVAIVRGVVVLDWFATPPYETASTRVAG